MFTPSTARVRHLIDTVVDPASEQGLAATGRILDIRIANGVVDVVIEAPSGQGRAYAPLAAQIEQIVGKLWGVKSVRVAITSDSDGTAKQAPAAPAAPKHGPVMSKPKGVKHLIAVCSAKGGVGKSTIAVNLALAFHRQGLRVGVLDADVYGPSAPVLLNLSGKPKLNDAGLLMPHEAYGLKVLSMGFVSPPDQAMIWRGPMVSGAVAQLLSGADWGDLDVLVIDTPPGTGDILLSLAQKAGLDGVVIVSTPQAMALADVIRGTAMFEKLGVPILGVIENMAWFDDPSGARHHLFGDGGAERLATALGVPFLGALPLDTALRAASDAGEPLGGETVSGQWFVHLGAALWGDLKKKI
jgi:ATP-binding protein involved in chromosome partitioning